ncbi:MAG: flagellar basal body P-ring formation chaperone FlgA [Pseudomonadota bacterium]
MMTRTDMAVSTPSGSKAVMRLVITAAALVLLGALAHAGDVLSGIHIHVRESSDIKADKILLGDIADIEAPGFLKQRLAAIDVGFAPRLGDLRILQGSSVRSRIESDPLVSGDTDLTVPEKVFVGRMSQEVSTEKLRDVFQEYVSKRLSGQDFSIRDFSVRGLVTYPAGDLSLSVIPGSDTDIRGRQTLQVSVGVGNESFGRIALSGWIDVFENVVCASRTMPRGTVLAPGDVQVERINLSRGTGDFLSSLDKILGMVLRSGVKKGASITQSMLDSPPLVHTGDIVSLRATKGRLVIVALGIARGEGRQGDQIRVENMTSNRVVYGTVAGESRVDVLY